MSRPPVGLWAVDGGRRVSPPSTVHRPPSIKNPLRPPGTKGLLRGTTLIGPPPGGQADPLIGAVSGAPGAGSSASRRVHRRGSGASSAISPGSHPPRLAVRRPTTPRLRLCRTEDG